MRAHILILSFVGCCVAVFDRPRAERPLSNVQFLVPFEEPLPSPASSPSPAGDADDVRTVKWLQRALQQYLNEHEHDQPATHYRNQPLLNTISIETIDGDDSQERSEEEERSPVVGVRPMLTFVDRTDRSDPLNAIADKILEALADDSQLDSLQNGERDTLHSAHGPLKLQSHEQTRDSSDAAALADYVRDLLAGRDDDPQLSHNKLQDHAPDSLQVNDLDSHMRLHMSGLPPARPRNRTPTSHPSPHYKMHPKPLAGGMQWFGPVHP